MRWYTAIAALLWAAVLLGGQSAAEPASVPGPVTEVRMHTGRPTFSVDGEPFTAPMFSTYVPEERYYAQMAEAGCRLFNFVTTCGEMVYGHCKPVWRGPDEWDFSEMDERAHAILDADPDALIMPRIFIGAPAWWREAHPAEMMQLEDGNYYYEEPFVPLVVPKKQRYDIPASEQWRRDMAGALKHTIRHIQESDWGSHVFGYQLSGLATEEWYHFGVNQEQLAGYSKPVRDGFQRWLERKYGSNEALREAWGDSAIRFETVEVPGSQARKRNDTTFRDPAAEMPVIDFYQFYNEVIPQAIDHFAAAAKEASGGRKVVGAFFGYFFEFSGNYEHGHNATHDALLSDHIDFLLAPPSYFDRQIGNGAELYRRPFLSGTLHNKLWFHDNDLASFRFYEMAEAYGWDPDIIERHSVVLAVQPTALQSIWQFQRAAGYVLCEGIAESFFDLHGGYYDDPRLLEGLSDIAAMLERSHKHDRSSVAEILVVADGLSASYGTYQNDARPDPHPNRINQALKAFQPGFLKCGAPFDSIFLKDLSLLDLHPYKLVVFLNTFHMTDAQRRDVNARVTGGGRTVLWCYAPGFFEGNAESAEAMQDLTGIRIVPGENTLGEVQGVLLPAAADWLGTELEGPLAEPFGLEGAIARLFYVDDPEARPLAQWASGEEVVMAAKQMQGWMSVYSLSPVMPPELVHALARKAGVHCYTGPGDTFQANASYISLNAAWAGRRTIRLPQPADVYDALSERRYYENVTEFPVSAMEGETRIFRYAPGSRAGGSTKENPKL